MSVLTIALITLGIALPANASKSSGAAPESVYTPPCTSSDRGYCTDKALYIDLDQGQDIYLRLNTAVGDVVSLLFPESVEFPVVPTVGNKSVHKVKARKNSLDVFVELPQGPDGKPRAMSPSALYGHRTVIQIDVAGGARRWHITLDVMVAPEELSVRAVSFRSPKLVDEEGRIRRRVDAAIANLKKEVEEQKAELRETARSMSYDVTTGLYAQGNSCSRSSNKSNRNNGIWARVLEVCKTGDRVFLRFELRNGHRSQFDLGLIEVIRGDDAENSEAASDAIVRIWDEDNEEAIESRVLAYRQTVKGAASIEAPDESDRWSLRISENGGKGRVLVVGGLRF